MKKQKMYFRMIISSLMRRRSRMLVALLAVAIGATILSGLVTIYYDIPRQMGQEFRSYGANMILLPAGENAALDADVTARAADIIPATDLVGMAPYRYETVKINEQPIMAAGTDLAQAQQTSPYWLVTGAWPQASREVLVGQEVASLIRLNVGSRFTVNGTDSAGESFSRDCTVSGILQTGGTEESFLFLSMEDLNDLMGDAGNINVVECSISADQDALTKIASELSNGLEDVTPRLVRRVTESEGTVLTKLQALVYLVTVVILLLTMICVATTMMAVVAERRREIGLKKALGADNKGIVLEFLGEAMLLGALGGLLGAGLGFAFAQTVSMQVFSRAIAFQPLLVPVTLVVSVLITAVSCMIPVRRATDVDPAIVLRGE